MAIHRLHTSLAFLTIAALAGCAGGELDSLGSVPGAGTGGAPGTGGAAAGGKGGTAGKGGASGATGGSVGKGGAGQGGAGQGGAGQGGATGGTAGQAGSAGQGGLGGQSASLGLDAAPAAATLGTATFAQALDVVIPAGPFAFGIQSAGGVAVLDLANPTSTKTASTIPTPAKVVGIEYDDANGLVYLLDAGGTVTVTRLFTAESPTVLASKAGLPAGATAMARVGNRLFVVAGTTLQPLTIDLSAPQSPQLTIDAAVTLAMAPTHLAGGGGSLYLGYASGLVHAWSAPIAGAPVQVGSFDLGGPVAALASKGSKVIGLAKTKGMRVVDFGVPAKPTVLWQDAELYDVAVGQVHGRTLVVGLDRQYVSVLDLSDFAHPRAVTTNKGVLPKWVSFVEGNLVFGTGTTATIASVPPFVAARVPAITMQGFSPWGAVPVTFNKRIDPATAASLALTCGGNAVKGGSVVSPDALTVSFRPSSPLPAATSCTLSYGGVKDTGGNAASTPSGASLTFTTSSDAAAPFMQPHSAYPHTSDGAFTDWTSTPPAQFEWFDVKPAKGMYTYFYADFDPAASKLWLLNDWFYDGDDIEPDCYNQFQAWTGDGKEQWEIRAYGDKHVEVRKNGAVLDPKTAGVDGGFSYGASPNVATPHTQYELGIPASAGQWGVQLHDPGPAFQCKKLASEPTSVAGTTSAQASTVDPTHAVTVPGVPQLVSPGGSASLTPTLTWSTPDTWNNFDAYVVTLGLDPQLATGRWTYWAYGSSVTLPDGLLGSGTTYYWSVVAYNGAGQAISTVGSFTTAGSAGTGGMGGAGGGGGMGGAGGTGAGGGGTGATCAAYNDNGTQGMSTTGNLKLGIKHVATDALTVTGAELWTGGLDAAMANTLALYADAGDQPGQPLATGQWVPTKTIGWQGVAFDVPVTLQVGGTYWLVWTPDSGEVFSQAASGTMLQYKGYDPQMMVWNGPYNGPLKYRLDCATGGTGGAGGIGGAGGTGGAGAGGAGAGGAGAGGAGGSGGAPGMCPNVLFGTEFDQTALSPDGVAFADFNGDLKLDVVAGETAASTFGAQVFLGDGTGALGAKQPVQTGQDARNPVTADFNGDGKMDFAVLGIATSEVLVALGKGDGTFILPPVAVAVGAGAGGLAAADLNGDGVPDLVSSSVGLSKIRMMIGNGNGTFQAATDIGDILGGADSVAVRDMNFDGKIDVVAHGSASGDVVILLSNGGGAFAAPAVVTTLGTPGRLHLGNFDMGTRADIMLVNGTTVSTMLGHGDGTYDAPLTYAASGTGVFTGDVDGDGVEDLFDPIGTTLFVHRADGTGNFPGNYKITLLKTGLGGGASADVNGDGLIDAVLAGGGALPQVSVVLNICGP